MNLRAAVAPVREDIAFRTRFFREDQPETLFNHRPQWATGLQSMALGPGQKLVMNVESCLHSCHTTHIVKYGQPIYWAIAPKFNSTLTLEGPCAACLLPGHYPAHELVEHWDGERRVPVARTPDHALADQLAAGGRKRGHGTSHRACYLP